MSFISFVNGEQVAIRFVPSVTPNTYRIYRTAEYMGKPDITGSDLYTSHEDIIVNPPIVKLIYLISPQCFLASPGIHYFDTISILK